jgi:hypothetical protein
MCLTAQQVCRGVRRHLARRSEALRRFLPRANVFVFAALLAAVVAGAGAPEASAAQGPTTRARPMVAGPATQGERLFGVKGSWLGSGKVKYAYQWFRCDQMGAHCVAVRGATKRIHSLGGNDVGHTLGLSVRATDSRGSTTAVSGLIGPIGGAPPALVSTTQPTVSGEAVQGSALKVEAGTWKPVPESFSYQWVRCSNVGRACQPITGATADTYQVGAPDLGHALAAIVQARSGATSQAVFSVAKEAVVAGVAPAPEPAPAPGPTPAPGPAPVDEAVTGPLSSAPPLVAFVIQQGKQLTGAVGSWSGAGAIKYAYQWQRCDTVGAHCTSIRGATGRTYTFVAKDVGRTIGFRVRATDKTGTTRASASLVGPVAGPRARLVSTGQPTITGVPAEGQTLQVSPGSWNVTPTTIEYQWLRCNPNGRRCEPLPGATASTYAVTAADTRHALLAVVHATAGAASQAAVSVATPLAVTAQTTGPSSRALPTVIGMSKQGRQLTGSTGIWSGSGVVGYGYQWYRCDAAGAHCKSVRGATRPTYTLVAKDVGQTLGFAVHATDATGTATAYAKLIGPIAATSSKLVATAQPTIVGAAKLGQTLQVSEGTWNRKPDSVTYAWQRCNPNGRLCVPIAGATAGTYAVAAEDAGYTLVAVVQAQANGVQAQAKGVTQAALSIATPVVS